MKQTTRKIIILFMIGMMFIISVLSLAVRR